MKIPLATVARTLLLASLAAGPAFSGEAAGGRIPPAVPGVSELFFSEYIEGTSNNKALEIFNGTGASIDLAAGSYNVQMYFNGSASAGLTINMTGAVADGDVYVLAQSSASPAILSQADQTSGAGWFNGDDAVVLRKGTIVIDVVGQIGLDPGTEWGSSLTSTMDNTLRRKSSVLSGDPNGADAFDPSLEWDGFATDTFGGLGVHSAGNAPVVAVCDGPLTTDAGTPNSSPVSASDADGTVVNIVITSVTPSPAPGTVSLSNFIPAVGVGDTATVDVDVDTEAPADTYAVLITATNDDPTPQSGSCTLTVIVPPAIVPIHDIQGAGHLSPMAGALVSTTGIVTAKPSNGFYLQDPNPDGDEATSEGLFVFTSSAPPVSIGDSVRVSGTVVEFRPGGSGGLTNLTTTEISNPGRTVAVLSSGNPLPAPTVIGIGGRVPPVMVIDDDAAGSVETGGVFEPATDGIDFYESLEGMRVQVNDAVAVGPRNAFGEIPVVGDDGANAALRTPRAGIVIQLGDFNPERIILDDVLTPTPSMNVGDHFTTSVVGVMDYSFGNFKLLTTTPLTAVSGGLAQEIAAAPAPYQLAVAAFNVENLDPLDGAAKFDELAALIVDHLQSPDILAVEEIQDNNGPINDAVVAADLTYGMLIAAIELAGGPTYDFRQISPVDDQDGGEPGGNIRVGFLFRTDRGLTFIDRPGGASTTPTTIVSGPDGPQLSASPGRIDPTNSAFATSRKPLAGEFDFRGDRVFVIANHFNSKGGDQPLFGRFQPPTLLSEVQRLLQAQIVHDFVEDILDLDSQANVIVLGDLNDFEFSAPLLTLKGDILEALIETLPEGERYTYVFDGNSQVLDHILLSSSFFDRPFGYDVVHVNSEFADQASDHEPQVVHLSFAPSLDQLEGLLDFYANTGEITGNNTLKNLRGHLDKAREALAEGNQSQYEAQLQAFANQVRGYSPQFVTPEAAEALAAEAELLGDQG